jgi:hypothetical protein
MSANERITSTHVQRYAYVYVRQSTAAQVQYNRESTDRQYKLAERAVRLGWPRAQVKIIDEDLARSGSDASERSGFATMITEVALGHVGLILSIEVSRVARNNTDWKGKKGGQTSTIDYGPNLCKLGSGLDPFA